MRHITIVRRGKTWTLAPIEKAFFHDMVFRRSWLRIRLLFHTSFVLVRFPIRYVQSVSDVVKLNGDLAAMRGAVDLYIL